MDEEKGSFSWLLCIWTKLRAGVSNLLTTQLEGQEVSEKSTANFYLLLKFFLVTILLLYIAQKIKELSMLARI